MRAQSSTMPPRTGMGFPSRLEPAPRAVSGRECSYARRTTAATSSVESGQTTASGRAPGSDEASRDAASRSAARVEHRSGRSSSSARSTAGSVPGAIRAPGLQPVAPGEQVLVSEVELDDVTEHVGGALERAALLLVVGRPRRPAAARPAEEVEGDYPIPVDGIDEAR